MVIKNPTYVRALGSESDSFPAGVRLRQGCTLPPMLFVMFMDRIMRRDCGGEGIGELSKLFTMRDSGLLSDKPVFQGCLAPRATGVTGTGAHKLCIRPWR